MVSLNKDLANVVGGTTARACDNCISKRARLYCAADDAFLCQSCDGSIHAANPLASRHERVHIKVASLKLSSSPPWHQGFTRKPRTPRKTRKTDEVNGARVHLVPEIGNDEMNTITSCDQGQDQDQDQDQEQVLYQVPVFDRNHHGTKPAFELNSFNGLMLPTDVELAEFAADVESLLGKGLDGECFAMEGLGLLDCREKDSSMERSSVKVEDDERIMETMKDPFDELSFDYDSPMWEEKDDQKVVVEVKEDVDDDVNVNMRRCDDGNKKNCRILKLDLEGIMAAWDEQRSPWTTGDRPELDPDDCWPECMGGCGIMHHHHHYNNNHGYGDHMGMMMNGNPAAMLDGGREARVSRYREKRRTRLFSKKIRYEVRKLNAEKRPRMKGRFVKRSTSSSSS